MLCACTTNLQALPEIVHGGSKQLHGESSVEVRNWWCASEARAL